MYLDSLILIMRDTNRVFIIKISRDAYLRVVNSMPYFIYLMPLLAHQCWNILVLLDQTSFFFLSQ